MVTRWNKTVTSGLLSVGEANLLYGYMVMCYTLSRRIKLLYLVITNWGPKWYNYWGLVKWENNEKHKCTSICKENVGLRMP